MPDPNAKRLLWYLFAGSKGGNNRIKIVGLLKERPYNINQLSEALGLDYKAIRPVSYTHLTLPTICSV